MSPQPNEELKPYTVEVDDHSDDCGTVYRLKGPNVGILSKDEELLKERAEDFNLGFEMGRRSQEAPQGKREWSLEVEDARTLAAYWLMTDERSRREMWQSDIKKICEQLLKATEVQAALSGGGDERWEKEAPVAPVRKWEADRKAIA